MKYQDIRQVTQQLLLEVSQFNFERTSIIEQIDVPLKSVVILKGLRGIGKTTALLQFLQKQNLAKLLYVPANSTLIENTRLIEIAKEFETRGGGYLVFDEIHKYQDWEREVLDIVNFYSNIKLILSGSSSLQIDQHSADLSRRHIMIEAHGLSFREWVKLQHGFHIRPISLKEILKHAEDLALEINTQFKSNNLSVVSEFHKYLKDGYFPTRRQYKKIELYYQSLKNSLNAVIEQDIPNRFPEITEQTKYNIKRLLGSIAGQCPFTPNITLIKQALQLGDDKTVKNYLHMLHTGQAITCLYRNNKNYKDIPKPEKIYLENTNFMYALNDYIDIGNLRETFAACSLNKIASINAPKNGDLIVNGNIVFEIGGKGKRKKQIKKIKQAYVLNDNIDYAHKNHLPLWILGFLW